MFKKSLAKELLNSKKDTPIENKIKETVGILSLLELESLQKKLDDYYKAIYNT